MNNDMQAMCYAYDNDGPNKEISEACLTEITQGSFAARTRYGGGNVTIRDSLTQSDYQFYRPSEAIPRKQKEIIFACDDAYQRIGLLRNIIDLMSDFASQGIDIYHPNKIKQKRYRAWFNRVNGKERSERFLNLLYRHGNVVVKKSFADLNLGDRKDLERGVAAKDDVDITYERSPKFYRNRIPLKYAFINPTSVDVIGGDLALFSGELNYALRLPEALIKIIKNPKTPDDIRLVGKLPKYIVDMVRNGKKSIPLDSSKIEVYCYKKDDWQQWANPMTYSILADLKLYEKNKLADMAALDGAVSHIRLWTLGLPEYKIQPGPAAFARLREQLALASGGGGTLDLIWDASLNLKESSTDIYNFLGMKKYEPVLQAIYAGLGIPQSLTGGGNTGAGMTGSVISLKTLIERLQYGRDLLQKFWNKELNILQEAFGDRQPAQIHFDSMSLSDEANEKMLWFHLYDRDIISLDTIREKFGTLPEVEDARVRSDYKGRDKENVPDKSGPFVDGQPEFALKKIALQTGVVSPKDVGLDKGDDRLIDVKVAATPPPSGGKKQKKNSGTPGQGRPPGKGDSQKRKKRVDVPRVSASEIMNTQIWARQTQKIISNVINPLFLKECNKNNMRQLTSEEAVNIENLKFNILCSCVPGFTISEELIIEKYNNPPQKNIEICDVMNKSLANLNSKPSLDEIREMQIISYSLIWCN